MFFQYQNKNERVLHLHSAFTRIQALKIMTGNEPLDVKMGRSDRYPYFEIETSYLISYLYSQGNLQNACVFIEELFGICIQALSIKRRSLKNIYVVMISLRS